MKEKYNQKYYLGYCKGKGYNTQQLKKLMKINANLIKNFLNPKIVLDIGCAFGFLVKEFNLLNINCYGIDFSEYAILQVDKEIKNKCICENILNIQKTKLNRYYDIIICIEVLQHLQEQDSNKMIQIMTKMSGKIIFSSSNQKQKDETHINTHEEEYWINKFNEKGFLLNKKLKGKFFCEYSLFFEKFLG